VHAFACVPAPSSPAVAVVYAVQSVSLAVLSRACVLLLMSAFHHDDCWASSTQHCSGKLCNLLPVSSSVVYIVDDGRLNILDIHAGAARWYIEPGNWFTHCAQEAADGNAQCGDAAAARDCKLAPNFFSLLPVRRHIGNFPFVRGRCNPQHRVQQQQQRVQREPSLHTTRLAAFFQHAAMQCLKHGSRPGLGSQRLGMVSQHAVGPSSRRARSSGAGRVATRVLAESPATSAGPQGV
jgi:hypothetical protein